jgi:non-ribosomal peptide synthetase component F
MDGTYGNGVGPRGSCRARTGVIGSSTSLTACLARQVGERRAATAIVEGGRSWTYGDLNREAGRIAALLLHRRGSDSESIALLFPHGAAMIAAILGVLGAGKSYVPLYCGRSCPRAAAPACLSRPNSHPSPIR